MVDNSVPKSGSGDRKGKRPGRRSRGVRLQERDGNWHAVGSLGVAGRSIRIRQSLGLAVAATAQSEAESARHW